MLHIVNHVAGVAILLHHSVNARHDVDVMRVGHELLGNDKGSERRRAIQALAREPIWARKHRILAMARATVRHVVHDGVAEHIIQGLLLRHAEGRLVNNDGKLALPVNPVAAFRNVERRTRINDTGARRLGEDEGIIAVLIHILLYSHLTRVCPIIGRHV